VMIENPGDTAVDVAITVETPRPLLGAIMGETLGSDMSAAPWTEIRPSEFRLRPHGRQRVRVISKVPREELRFANYYADLILKGNYADGQSGGETRSQVWLANRDAEVAPEGIFDRLTLAEGERQSEYVVQSRYVNVGNIHVEPKVRAELVGANSFRVLETELEGASGVLLPLGLRDYGNPMDFSKVPPGDYTLRVVSALGGGSVSKELRLNVSLGAVEAGKDPETAPRVVTILDAAS
jgi:hypothetical protein